MKWQDEWRAKVHGWIMRLNALALNWHQLNRHGVRLALDRRKAALRVRDWMYEVADIYLGGIDKLPNKVPVKPGELGAINLALVGAGVAVTVATVGAWISNEEERVILAKAKLVEAIGKEAREAKDPAVAKALAGVASRLDPNEKSGGLSWQWIAVPVAIGIGAHHYLKARAA